MASAAFHFDAQATGVKVAVATSGTTTAALDSTVGVRTVAWDIMGTDDNAPVFTIATPTATSTVVTAPGSVTAPGGAAAILRCRVNGGDGATDGSTYKAKIYIVPEVAAIGETDESDRTYGWCKVVNPVLRTLQTGSNPVIQAASGGYVELREFNSPVMQFSDDGTVSFANGQGAGGTRLAASAGSLTLRCAATGVIQLQESTTDVCWVFDAANVSTIQGKGSGGTIFGASTGNLTAKCASGSKIVIAEDTTTICELYDSGGQRRHEFPANTVLAATGYYVVQTTAHFGVEGATGIYLSADNHYFRSANTVTTYGTIASGVWTIGTSGGTAVHAINGSTATTPVAGGAADALPANPVGYLRVSIGGTTRKIPFYADS